MPIKVTEIQQASIPSHVPSTDRQRNVVFWGRTMVLVSVVAVLVERFTAVASDLHLWGDGAWMLVRIASAHDYYFWVGDWKSRLFQSRFFTILLEQTPAVIATHLRIHSLHTISLIYGITLYSHALLSLYLCYRYTPRRWYILFPLLSFFAGPMNVEAYLSTDSHLIVSLYWPVLFILLFRTELKRGTLLLLLCLSLPMLIAYESMLFFGFILAGVCIWRIKRYPQQRNLLAGLTCWYVMGMLIAVVSILRPFDPGNRTGFFHGLKYLLLSTHITAQVSVLTLVCSFVVLVLPCRATVMRAIVAVVGLAGVTYLMQQILTGHTPTGLEGEVAARTLNLISPLVASILLLLVLSGVSRPPRQAIAFAALLIGSLGLGQALWNLAAIGEWRAYLAMLRYDLQQHEGPVPYEDSILSRDKLGPLPLKRMEMSWALLPLSLYEAGQGQIRSIITPEASNYFPFDPYAVAALPDLSRYRIYYDDYRQTLEKNWRYSLGETLNFQAGGSSARFMRGSWADPESWASWGNGEEFGLDLPISAQTIPADGVKLWALVSANVSPKFPNVSVQVLVNDVQVDTWSVDYTPEGRATLTARIPKSVLLAANPVRVRFRVIGPLRSPADMGTGPDPRKLSLAFLKLRIEGAND